MQPGVYQQYQLQEQPNKQLEATQSYQNGYSQPSYQNQGAQQYSQPQYSQPQYSQPQYSQPQYSQPQYSQPQYSQPQYSQPQYSQPQYSQPQYSQPQYSQPQYGQPQQQAGGYGQEAAQYQQPYQQAQQGGYTPASQPQYGKSPNEQPNAYLTAPSYGQPGMTPGVGGAQGAAPQPTLVSQPQMGGYQQPGPYNAGPDRGGVAKGLQPQSNATNTLFVDGLPDDVSKRELAHVFRPFKGFKEARIVMRDSKRNRGETVVLGFIEFQEPYEAGEAFDQMNEYVFDQEKGPRSRIRISFSNKPSSNRPGNTRGDRPGGRFNDGERRDGGGRFGGGDRGRRGPNDRNRGLGGFDRGVDKNKAGGRGRDDGWGDTSVPQWTSGTSEENQGWGPRGGGRNQGPRKSGWDAPVSLNNQGI